MSKKKWLNKCVYVLLDAFAVVFSLFLAANMRFDGAVPPSHIMRMQHALPVLLALYLLSYFFFGIYRTIWRYAGARDMIRLAVATATGGLIGFLLNYAAPWGQVSRPIVIMTALFYLAITCLIRLCARYLSSPRSHQRNQTPVLVVGAGVAGSAVITSLTQSVDSEGTPVALVDDNPAKRNQRVRGVPVRGTIADIPEIVRKHEIQKIIIAMPSVRGERLREVISLCTNTKCRVLIMNDPSEVGNRSASLRELNLADFLSRDEVTLDTNAISGYLAGKTVLVTGGGGSIGSELCRQILRFHPKLLVIFDIYENSTYELEYELVRRFGRGVPIAVLIGSVRDRRRLDEVMETYHPEVVFHAAAHKHVPLMEDSPAEAIKNNVFGTRQLLESADLHGVKRFVQISTDKAVNPTNVMGATKRVCEMLIQSFARSSKMQCMAVRFGNVLGSHGSVIPLWEAQIRAGGPVTLVHPDITRYFMTIPEAAQLVLQAGGLAESGAIYVLDMGAPVRIADLADKLIRFYGYEPGVDIAIDVVGLRPGEKMYEELMLDNERAQMRRTGHNKIFVAPPLAMDEALFQSQLSHLAQSGLNNDANTVALLKEIVPTFISKDSQSA